MINIPISLLCCRAVGKKKSFGSSKTCSTQFSVYDPSSQILAAGLCNLLDSKVCDFAHLLPCFYFFSALSSNKLFNQTAKMQKAKLIRDSLSPVILLFRVSSCFPLKCAVCARRCWLHSVFTFFTFEAWVEVFQWIFKGPSSLCLSYAYCDYIKTFLKGTSNENKNTFSVAFLNNISLSPPSQRFKEGPQTLCWSWKMEKFEERESDKLCV